MSRLPPGYPQSLDEDNQVADTTTGTASSPHEDNKVVDATTGTAPESTNEKNNPSAADGTSDPTKRSADLQKAPEKKKSGKGLQEVPEIVKDFTDVTEDLIDDRKGMFHRAIRYLAYQGKLDGAAAASPSQKSEEEVDGTVGMQERDKTDDTSDDKKVNDPKGQELDQVEVTPDDKDVDKTDVPPGDRKLANPGKESEDQIPDEATLAMHHRTLNEGVIRLLVSPQRIRPITFLAERTLSPGERYPFARSSERHDATPLPDAQQVFDNLLKSPQHPQSANHPNGINGFYVALATIISLTLVRIDGDKPKYNGTSPTLDLSPLYGVTKAESDLIRAKDGRGMLSPDCFYEDRAMFLSPAVSALLILWNRNHNFIARRLLLNNEQEKWVEPAEQRSAEDTLSPRLRSQDDEIFKIARAINCIQFKNVFVEDFLKVILGLPSAGPGPNLDVFIGLDQPGQATRKTSEPFKQPAEQDKQPAEPDKQSAEPGQQLAEPSKQPGEVTQQPKEPSKQPVTTDTLKPSQTWKMHVSTVEFSLVYSDWSSMASLQDIEAFEHTLMYEKYLTENKDRTNLIFDMDTRGFQGLIRDVEVRNSNRRQRNFYRLQRGSDARFNDVDLARVLQDATEQGAGTARARSIHPCFRSREIMTIERARMWKVGTLNEFRKFLGLKPLKDFEEWNSDKVVAKAAEDLYKDINSLELYPGLHAEETFSKTMTSGVSLGYTLTYALLVDLVTLIRSDSRFTMGVTPVNLTHWGFKDCTAVPNDGAFGTWLPKLLERNLPRNYPYDNIYSLFPLTCPRETKDLLRHQLRQNPLPSGMTYTYERPKVQKVHEVETKEAISHVFNNPTTYPTSHGKDFRALFDGYGFFLGFDNTQLHDRDLMMTLFALTPDKGALARYGNYFGRTAATLIREKSRQTNGQISIDIVQDVINATCTRWVCATLCGLPVPERGVEEATILTLLGAPFASIVKAVGKLFPASQSGPSSPDKEEKSKTIREEFAAIYASVSEIIRKLPTMFRSSPSGQGTGHKITTVREEIWVLYAHITRVVHRVLPFLQAPPDEDDEMIKRHEDFAALYVYMFRNVDPEAGWAARTVALERYKALHEEIMKVLPITESKSAPVIDNSLNGIWKDLNTCWEVLKAFVRDLQDRWELLQKYYKSKRPLKLSEAETYFTDAVNYVKAHPEVLGGEELLPRHSALTFLRRIVKSSRAEVFRLGTLTKRGHLKHLVDIGDRIEDDVSDRHHLQDDPSDEFEDGPAEDIEDDMTHEIAYREKRLEERRILANVIGLAVVTSVKYAHACSQAVDFYLDDNRLKEREDIIRLSALTQTEARKESVNAKLMGYIREAQRLGQNLGLWREVSKNDKIPQGHGLPDISVHMGDRIFADFSKAHTNPSDFDRPLEINPDRKTPSIQGMGLHKCPGMSFVDQTMPELFKAIFRLKNLRRDSRGTGRLREIVCRPAPLRIDPKVYLNSTGEISHFPRSLSLHYDDGGSSTKAAKRSWAVGFGRKRACLNYLMWFLIFILVVLVASRDTIVSFLSDVRSSLTRGPTRSPRSPIREADIKRVPVACPGPTTTIHPYEVMSFVRGSDGLHPDPIEYNLNNTNAHRLILMAIDTRDLRMGVYVDDELRGMTSGFVRNSSDTCGDRFQDCHAKNFSSGVFTVPPGDHSVKIDWVGNGFIPNTINEVDMELDWEKRPNRRFLWRKDLCA
ncbi:hypothetical protein FPV67DRAFT_1500614 [Lyophyllum atratum]|nr:hypothetical protein FPV67DRAFT_1500614 [Lyophyllum atratum]